MTILEKELKKIPARVKKGIKWFEDLGISKDELEELITPEELRMSDCEHCMVGQVIGSYWYAFPGSDVLEVHDVPYGFDVPMNLKGETR